MLTIPDLDLIPGTVICLHLPPGTIDPTLDLKHKPVQLANRQSKIALVASPAESRRGIRERLRPQTSIEWLVAAAKVSYDEAAAIIRGFGIGVRPVMSHNAGDPRAFLGVAAALANRPDVLIYETTGMSPRGQYRLHEYIAERGSEFCAVHISYPGVYGTGERAPRICPERARCLELVDNSRNSINSGPSETNYRLPSGQTRSDST